MFHLFINKYHELDKILKQRDFKLKTLEILGILAIKVDILADDE